MERLGLEGFVYPGMALSLAQYRSFLESEGYPLQSDGTLSEEDFYNLSSRLNDSSFVVPDEIIQSDFYSFLYDSDYQGYVDDFKSKYYTPPTAALATRGNSGVFAPPKMSVVASSAAIASFDDLLGGNPSEEEIREVAQAVVAADDPLGTFSRLSLYSQNNGPAAEALFVAMAYESPVFAGETMLEGMDTPARKAECGNFLKALYAADEEWFNYVCNEADNLEPNSGFKLSRIAGQSVNVDRNEGYHDGIYQDNTQFGTGSPLADELAGDDQHFSAEEILAYITNQDTATAYITGATAQDRIREVAAVIARELSGTVSKEKQRSQYRRAAVVFDDMTRQHNVYAGELFAVIYRMDPDVGWRIMVDWCDQTTDQRLLEATAPTIRGSMGHDAYYAMYDSLPQSAQGLLEPKRNVTSGASQEVQEQQVAVNRTGLAEISGSDEGFSEMDISRKHEELNAFLEVIPSSVRATLAADEQRLLEIYAQWGRQELPMTEAGAKALAEEVGGILTKFQIESVLAQQEVNVQAVEFTIANGNLNSPAREEMGGLLSEMRQTYAFLFRGREAYQSGDMERARGMLTYATANLMLIQQSMEVTEALSLARDSGMDNMGYRNGNPDSIKDREMMATLTRLELAAKRLADARHSLGRAQVQAAGAPNEEALQGILTGAEETYENSIGQIRSLASGRIRDIGWHFMQQDQSETQALILGAKFAAGTAAMVALFCVAGPAGAYVGAKVSGVAIWLGASAGVATASGVILGLGAESLIFLCGEKVIAAGGAAADVFIKGGDWDEATDAALEQVVFHSLEEAGWEYAGTVVSLGILKTFTHGTQALIKQGRLSEGALTYGTGFLAEMTGMGMGGVGVETLQYTFGHEPVYILVDGVPTEVTDLSQIWDGDHIKDNIVGSFQTVLTYRIAGRLMKSGTEPISRTIHEAQVRSQIKMFEGQEASFREKLKKVGTLAEFEKLSAQRIQAGHALYAQSLQSLYAKGQQARTPEEKAALKADIAAVEKKAMEYDAMQMAFEERAAIARDMGRRVAEYNAKRYAETHAPAETKKQAPEITIQSASANRETLAAQIAPIAEGVAEGTPHAEKTAPRDPAGETIPPEAWSNTHPDWVFYENMDRPMRRVDYEAAQRNDTGKSGDGPVTGVLKAQINFDADIPGAVEISGSTVERLNAFSGREVVVEVNDLPYKVIEELSTLTDLRSGIRLFLAVTTDAQGRRQSVTMRVRSSADGSTMNVYRAEDVAAHRGALDSHLAGHAELSNCESFVQSTFGTSNFRVVENRAEGEAIIAQAKALHFPTEICLKETVIDGSAQLVVQVGHHALSTPIGAAETPLVLYRPSDILAGSFDSTFTSNDMHALRDAAVARADGSPDGSSDRQLRLETDKGSSVLSITVNNKGVSDTDVSVILYVNPELPPAPLAIRELGADVTVRAQSEPSPISRTEPATAPTNLDVALGVRGYEYSSSSNHADLESLSGVRHADDPAVVKQTQAFAAATSLGLTCRMDGSHQASLSGQARFSSGKTVIGYEGDIVEFGRKEMNGEEITWFVLRNGDTGKTNFVAFDKAGRLLENSDLVASRCYLEAHLRNVGDPEVRRQMTDIYSRFEGSNSIEIDWVSPGEAYVEGMHLASIIARNSPLEIAFYYTVEGARTVARLVLGTDSHIRVGGSENIEVPVFHNHPAREYSEADLQRAVYRPSSLDIKSLFASQAKLAKAQAAGELNGIVTPHFDQVTGELREVIGSGRGSLQYSVDSVGKVKLLYCSLGESDATPEFIRDTFIAEAKKEGITVRPEDIEVEQVSPEVFAKRTGFNPGSDPAGPKTFTLDKNISVDEAMLAGGGALVGLGTIDPTGFDGWLAGTKTAGQIREQKTGTQKQKRIENDGDEANPVTLGQVKNGNYKIVYADDMTRPLVKPDEPAHFFNEKTPDGRPEPKDDGSGKGGGPAPAIDPLRAIAREPVRQRSPTASWDRLDLSPTDVDLLYAEYEALPPQAKKEHGLFRSGDGTRIIVPGGEQRAESLILEVGDEGDGGRVTELSSLAHVHPEEPLPSLQDLTVFAARARLNPGRSESHIVLGYVDGKRAFVKMNVVFDGQSVRFQFETSSNFPENLKRTLNKRSAAIAKLVAQSRDRNLESWRQADLASDDAALCYDFAAEAARRALEATQMPDAERAALQKMIGRVRLEVIENQFDLEPILSAFEVYVVRDLPQQPGKGSSLSEIQLDYFEHFVEDCRYLLNDRGLDQSLVKEIMGGAYGPPRDFIVSLKADPSKLPLLTYQARQVKIDRTALKQRHDTITRSIHPLHEVRRWIQSSVDTPGFAENVYQSLGIDTRVITKKIEDPALCREDKAHIRSKRLLYQDMEKRTVNRRHYEAVIASLSAVELDVLMELKRFFGDQLFWQVMSNPSLYPPKDTRYTLLKTILNTLDLYRVPDGKIEEKYRSSLEEHFVSGKQNLFGQPDVRPDKDTGIPQIKDLWGTVAEFKLMTMLKFSSSDPDSFVLGEKLPYSKKDKDECDAYYKKARTIHECKNCYLGIDLKTIMNDQFKKHIYSLKNNGVGSLEYDLITHVPREFDIDRKVIERVGDAVRREGLKADQTLVINLYNMQGQLGRKIVIGADGTVLLDTARP